MLPQQRIAVLRGRVWLSFAIAAALGLASAPTIASITTLDAASATRAYVYDTNARLCKTLEPESGATVQAYDSANNIAWRASGLALPSPSS